ncbi:MAG TPA: hypothetical protein VER37_05780 [Thermomicrobiales bacterium]|nr:hypothetical protein [Thermomicrobiales bacterium]
MPPIRPVLALLVVAALVVGLRGWLAGPSLVPDGSGVALMARAASTLTGPATPAEDRPRDGVTAEFARLLESDAALAGELVGLGEAKSRNLLAITGQQRRMGDLLDETDAFLATAELPAGAEPAVAAYRDGATAIRAAMAEAQAGFVRFDWERVGRATARMTEGEAALARAVSLVD